jgi:hypothetical protein
MKSHGFSFYSDICEYIFMLQACQPFHLLSKLFWAAGHFIYPFGVNLQFSSFKPGSYVTLSVRLEWSVEAVRWGYATYRYTYNDICMCEHEPSQTIFSFIIGTLISIYLAKPPKSRDLICSRLYERINTPTVDPAGARKSFDNLVFNTWC